MKSKIPKRTYTMGIRLKPHEKIYLDNEAAERGQRLSDYVRDVLLSTMNFTHSVGKESA
jgi:hypothetical protein